MFMKRFIRQMSILAMRVRIKTGGKVMSVDGVQVVKQAKKIPINLRLLYGFAAVLAVILLLCIPDLFAAVKKKNKSQPQLTVVSPPDAALITEKSIFLSGFISNADVGEVQISGSGIKAASSIATVTDGAFGSLITFKQGKNQIVVAAAGLSKKINIYYMPEDALKKSKKVPNGYKRFFVHQQTGQLNCRECHSFRRGKYNFQRIIPARSNCTTSECHPKIGKDAAHVHGPVGAGVCISCHNPHGSPEPLHLERDGQELCMVCHEAKRQEFDQEVIHPPVEEGCIDCHDPHQSSKRFQLRGDGDKLSSLCFNCHEDEMFIQDHQHGPVATGDCTACHNPHASSNNQLLVAPKEQGKLCFECHETVKKQMDRKNIHDPVAEDCGNCHDPHSSETEYQLVASAEKICESCHRDVTPEIYEAIDSAQYEHEPVAAGQCVQCHQPHGSDVESLLKGKGINLCGTCHEELGYDINESKNLHGPVKTGACTECHNVHGSEFSRLLVRYFPEKFYNTYEPGAYDLCFGCHNKDIAKTKDTEALTNFRDEKHNLHYFHVNQKKGRSCIACHAPHASAQYKHIRQEVPFGKWSYPIEYTPVENGGGCLVGCHAPKKDDRKKAANPPNR